MLIPPLSNKLNLIICDRLMIIIPCINKSCMNHLIYYTCEHNYYILDPNVKWRILLRETNNKRKQLVYKISKI